MDSQYGNYMYFIVEIKMEVESQSCVSCRYTQGSITIAALLSFIDISSMFSVFKMAITLTYMHKMTDFIVM